MSATTQKPAPFRADQVGSLLRSAALKDARDKNEKGALDAAGLAAVEDTEIKALIKNRKRWACSRLPMANTAGRGGITIFSDC